MSTDVVSTDVVSAEKAQQVIDAVNAACELGDMSSTEEAAALTTEALARTVLTLHARLSAQATELAVLRAQLGPLLAVHDALREAAALPGAGASGEEMVAAVRRKGAEAVRDAAMSVADDLAGDDEEWAHELTERVALAVVKASAGGV